MRDRTTWACRPRLCKALPPNLRGSGVGKAYVDTCFDRSLDQQFRTVHNWLPFRRLLLCLSAV